MKKTISIIGSTGSVGLSVLDIIDKKKDYFEVFLLSANKNQNEICKQIIKYRPKIFIISNPKIFNFVKMKFKKHKIKILNNFDHLKFKKKIEVTITAIPGLIGLQQTIKMTQLSKKF